MFNLFLFRCQEKYNLMLVLGLILAGVSFFLLGPIPLLHFVLPQGFVPLLH